MEVQLKMTAKGVMAGGGEHYFGPGKHDRGPGETHGGHIRMAFIGASEEDLVDAAGRIGQACAELAAEVPVEAASVATSGASGSSARLSGLLAACSSRASSVVSRYRRKRSIRSERLRLRA